mgnify:CR=1 FL=1
MGARSSSRKTLTNNDPVCRAHIKGHLIFYQLIDFKGEALRAQKLAKWEAFYHFMRPHAAWGGDTPYERLRQKLTA